SPFTKAIGYLAYVGNNDPSTTSAVFVSLIFPTPALHSSEQYASPPRPPGQLSSARPAPRRLRSRLRARGLVYTESLLELLESCRHKFHRSLSSLRFRPRLQPEAP